ncbi:hypothetical protein BT96DRAFT_947653 [Gymnopus androsaceus JB14]|uniref:Uncharacterized protein n=1 Tax=Gymnopus androsaceus JB14 TaxID=1447944 RepID=A0A6A4GRJ3_9AGAR|nr:hypothetical protein BT96DRAFT_947653 [Gymnopus androsaceus JB14]
MPESLKDGVEQKDVVKASPLKGGRLDTIFVLTGDSAESASLAGTGTGYVRILFHLPLEIKLIGSHKFWSPVHWPRTALAYIEWYAAPVLALIDQMVHNMASIQKAPLRDGAPPWSIISLTNIHQS